MMTVLPKSRGCKPCVDKKILPTILVLFTLPIHILIQHYKGVRYTNRTPFLFDTPVRLPVVGCLDLHFTFRATEHPCVIVSIEQVHYIQ